LTIFRLGVKFGLGANVIHGHACKVSNVKAMFKTRMGGTGTDQIQFAFVELVDADVRTLNSRVHVDPMLLSLFAILSSCFPVRRERFQRPSLDPV
jgi:hypothetical protein